MPDDLQLHGRLPAGDQHHAGDPRGLRCDRGAPRLTPPEDDPREEVPGQQRLAFAGDGGDDGLRLLIRADGAARGNPGPAAAGAVLIDASRPGSSDPHAPPVAVIARPLGVQTNNVAEYTAVLLALEKADLLGATEVELVLDSLLVVEQLAGRWKVRDPRMQALRAQVMARLSRLRRWAIRHERRERNHQADALANLALDDPGAALAIEADSAR